MLELDKAEMELYELRFKVEDRVECKCGDQWITGSVVKLFYTQSSFRPYECAAYLLRLDDKRLIYVPDDEDRVIRRPMDASEVQAMRRPPCLNRASFGGLPEPKAWRLSKSELWLPGEVLLKIVKINLDRANLLVHRLAVAQLSSVCKAWDAALLPLFHPGVPGVVSSAELRRLKRQALDQVDYPRYPHLASDAMGHSRKQHGARSGFLLPERMLAAEKDKTPLRTALIVSFKLRVQYHKRISIPLATPDQIRFDHLNFCTREHLDSLLRLDLYDRGSGSQPPSNIVAHLTNTVCLAYRILLVIRAVEARAIKLGDSAAGRETPVDSASEDGCTVEVSRADWRAPSPAGMLAQLAWDVHRQSEDSYRRMNRSLLGGSGATRIPISPADKRGLLLRLLSLEQLKAAHFPQGTAEDLLRKARQLFPLAFPKANPLASTPMVVERDSASCFASRLSFLLRPAHVSDLQAALCSTMHDLLGSFEGDEDDEGTGYLDYEYEQYLNEQYLHDTGNYPTDDESESEDFY